VVVEMVGKKDHPREVLNNVWIGLFTIDVDRYLLRPGSQRDNDPKEKK